LTGGEKYQYKLLPEIPDILSILTSTYGPQTVPPAQDVFEWVLWELVAYLAVDSKRLSAFCKLKGSIGTLPEQILAASPETLRDIGSAGIMPEQSVSKLRSAAEIAMIEFGGEVDDILALPLTAARKALQKFPSIGAPGADKILLFSRAFPIFALESNGLRALIRLGFGSETGDYTRSYRSAMNDLGPQLPQDYDSLISLHLLLRTHGRKTCRRTNPACADCPLSSQCAYATLGIRSV